MFRHLLASEWAPFGCLSEDQLSQLERHYELVTHWNKVLNLTRIQKLEDVVRFHYCESLFLASRIPVGRHSIVDIGSGAGFPGIPAAVWRPECSVTLVESHLRKGVFLSEACALLANVNVSQGRAEEVQGRFDWLVSRAVMPKAMFSLRLASNLAILMSDKDLASLPQASRIIPVPWGDHRIVALFHVEHEDAKI